MYEEVLENMFVWKPGVDVQEQKICRRSFEISYIFVIFWYTTDDDNFVAEICIDQFGVQHPGFLLLQMAISPFFYFNTVIMLPPPYSPDLAFCDCYISLKWNDPWENEDYPRLRR